MQKPGIRVFAFRVPASWVRELKSWAGAHDSTLQAIGEEALKRWASEHDVTLHDETADDAAQDDEPRDTAA